MNVIPDLTKFLQLPLSGQVLPVTDYELANKKYVDNVYLLALTQFVWNDGTRKITYSSVEPTSPQAGDIWIDISRL